MSSPTSQKSNSGKPEPPKPRSPSSRVTRPPPPRPQKTRPPPRRLTPPQRPPSANIPPTTAMPRKPGTPPQNKSEPASASNSQTIIPLKCEHKFGRKDDPHEQFKCSGCERSSNGERYRCDSSNCDKVFHNECKNFKETEEGHKHEYELRNHKKIFKCDGCKEEGFGKRFRCDQCGHELHTLCMFEENPVIVKWLAGRPFKFHKKANEGEGKLVCGACTNDIDGYFYHCANFVSPPSTKDGFYLHPCCVYLQDVLFAADPPEDKTPPTDKDERRYTLSHKVEYGNKCYLCEHWQLRRPNPGMSYVCDRGNHCYHVYCVRQVVHESWVTTNGHDVDNISKTLETVASKQIDKGRGGSSSSSSFGRRALKILGMILKMIASTLMGDPTFGIVHLFGQLLNN